MELIGLFPGRMKFAGEGGKPNPLVIFGELKSSISSLNIIPVDLDRIIAPRLSDEVQVLEKELLLHATVLSKQRLAVKDTVDVTGLNIHLIYSGCDRYGRSIGSKDGYVRRSRIVRYGRHGAVIRRIVARFGVFDPPSDHVRVIGRRQISHHPI